MSYELALAIKEGLVPTRENIRDFCRYKPKEGEGKTKQEFKNRCNINTIMSKYNKTGVLGEPLTASNRKPFFGDFSKISSMQEAQNMIIDANNQFMKLPANIRKEFGNDVLSLIEFLSDENNLEKAKELGLVKKDDIKIEPPIDTKSDVVEDKGDVKIKKVEE